MSSNNKGFSVVKETGEVVFYNKYDSDVILTPTKGPDTVIKSDEIDLTKPNCMLNGFTKKNRGTNSYLNGFKTYELNSHGKIKDLYKDVDKSIVINEL